TKESEKYDVVFDSVGNRSPGECKPVVNPGGAYVNTGATMGLFMRQGFNFLFSMRVHAVIVKANGPDLEYVKSLIEKGTVKTVIDKVYPTDEIAEAQKYSMTGRAKGKIVLKFAV